MVGLCVNENAIGILGVIIISGCCPFFPRKYLFTILLLHKQMWFYLPNIIFYTYSIF